MQETYLDMQVSSFRVSATVDRIAYCSTLDSIRAQQFIHKTPRWKTPSHSFHRPTPKFVLNIILRCKEEVTTVTGIKKRQAEALQQLEDLRVASSKLQRNCAERLRKHRKASVDAHNRCAGIREVEFIEGDFVLKAVPDKTIRAKTSLK